MYPKEPEQAQDKSQKHEWQKERGILKESPNKDSDIREGEQSKDRERQNEDAHLEDSELPTWPRMWGTQVPRTAG
jgi:hypothetical protein